jgi:hypothetical protein
MAAGDHVPVHDRERYVRDQLKPWTVIYFLCYFPAHHPRPSNNKYLLIASDLGVDIIALYINSRVSRLVASIPGRKRCQVLLPSALNPFLPKDSYLDCSDFLRLQTDYAIQKLTEDVWRIKGVVADGPLKERIIEAVDASITLPEGVRKRMLKSFRDL